MTAYAPTAAGPAYPVNAFNAAGGAASQLSRDAHRLRAHTPGSYNPKAEVVTWHCPVKDSQRRLFAQLGESQNAHHPKASRHCKYKHYKQKISKKDLMATSGHFLLRQGPHLPLPRRDMEELLQGDEGAAKPTKG